MFSAAPSTRPDADRPRPPSILHKAAYPILLSSVVGVTSATLHFGWDPGPVSLMFLLGTITYLTVLERVIPYNDRWQPTRREWGWYGVYFALSMLAGGLAQLPALALATKVAGPDAVFPLYVEMPLALLVGSLGSYIIHRLGHTNRWLWRIHGVHHVPEKVNVANNGVNHVVDVFIAQALVQMSLAFAGFSAEAVFATGLFIIGQGYFIHANIDVRLGRLNYVVATPEQHRLHHSTDLAEAGHYGADLPIWDLVFGSFTWQPGRTPAAVGLHDPTSFPETHAVGATLISPWRRRTAIPPRPDDVSTPVPLPVLAKEVTQ